MSSIRVFRTFAAVARYGSFAAASEHVALTPAAVGLQIQGLENDLGYALFDRQGRNVMLNQRGHALLPRAQQLIMQYETMLSDEGSQHELAGSLKVASIATSMGLLVRAVLRMRTRYSRLRVEPGISYSGDLLARVREGDIDVALSVKNPHGSAHGVLCTPLYQEPLVFIASRQAPAHESVAALMASRVFFQVSRASNTGTLINEFMRHQHLKAADFVEMNAMRTIVDLVRDDLGVTLLPLPRESNWDRDPDLRVVRFDDPGAFRTIALYENERRAFLSSVLRDHVRAEIDATPL